MIPSLDPAEMPGLLALLSGVAERHQPEVRPLLDRIGRHLLSENEREGLHGAPADELVSRGLGEDDEPNEYGLRIEHAIDQLGHL